MDAKDWTITIAPFALLWVASAWFRVGIKGGLAATFVLAVCVIAIYPDILEAL